MSDKKSVLFVTYGGGHVNMVLPVYKYIYENFKDIQTYCLALTTAKSVIEKAGLPSLSFKDFLFEEDTDALQYGKALADKYHMSNQIMSYDESVAYLGLSYADLVIQHGKKHAKILFDTKGRHAFYPITFMGRVLKKINPNMVVTTNSPRAEKAAIDVAKKMCIPTLSMVDLFGIGHFVNLEADIITSISQITFDNMEKEGFIKEGKQSIVTGNPSFDKAQSFQITNKDEWKKKFLPNIQKPVILWIDQPAYWNNEIKNIHVRSDNELVKDMDKLYAISEKLNATLLVRPHPSQDISIHKKWLSNNKNAYLCNQLDLHSLISISELIASHNSTVIIEAVFMKKKVLQLKFYSGQNDIPLFDWGMTWQAESYDEVYDNAKEAFFDDLKWNKKLLNINKWLPKKPAVPKIAKLILKNLKKKKL